MLGHLTLPLQTVYAQRTGCARRRAIVRRIATRRHPQSAPLALRVRRPSPSRQIHGINCSSPGGHLAPNHLQRRHHCHFFRCHSQFFHIRRGSHCWAAVNNALVARCTCSQQHSTSIGSRAGSSDIEDTAAVAPQSSLAA